MIPANASGRGLTPKELAEIDIDDFVKALACYKIRWISLEAIVANRFSFLLGCRLKERHERSIF